MGMKQIQKAFKDTLSEKWDIAAEALDLAIDSASEGVFNDIPIVGTGVKLLQTRDKYQEFKFRRNCQALLLACEQVDNEVKRKTLEKLSADPELFDDFSDTLLQIACESTKPLKVRIVGCLLAEMLRGRLDYETYDELVHIIHGSSIPALKALKKFFDQNEGIPYRSGPSSPDEPLLLSMGVASREGTKFAISGHGHIIYKLVWGPSPAVPLRP